MISALLKPSIVINGKKYKIMKQIGEGGFAFVYDVLGTGKESGEHFALKKMICQTDEQLDEAKKEIDTMLALKNPHVLEILDHAYSLNKKNQKEALLLLPLYQGSVQTVIDKGHGFPHCGFACGTDVLKILRQVIEGLKAIHAAGLRHADLKPANILLTDDYHAVITDFGSVSPSPVTIHTRAEALSAQDKASSCTTASYRAPELFNTPSECVLGGESDVWSLGCLIYCMFYSRTPFESAAEGLSTLSVIAAHYQVPESNLWPEEYLQVIAACLRAAPSEREGLDALQARLQSIPCPPLDTRPSLPPLAPPHTTSRTHSPTNTTSNTDTAHNHANANHTAVSKADTNTRLNSSTSTTSSAVSTSHLEFSEASSFPTTPVTPAMAVNFANFPDPAAGGGAAGGVSSSGDDQVYVHLSDGASVEFESGTALSEICFEEPTGTSVYGSAAGSVAGSVAGSGDRQGSSSDSVHNSSVVGGNSAYANSIAGSVYGSAYASSIADSYVHAGDALSNCSSGQHSPFEPLSDHNNNTAEAEVMIVNLPVVPVRKGLSTPNTHHSHESFEYVESSVGNSSPHTLHTASDDANDTNFASFPTFPAVANNASTTTTTSTLPPPAQRTTSIGIAEQAAKDEVEWDAEDEDVFKSDDEEFGEFTTSTNTTTTTAANINTSASTSMNTNSATNSTTTTNNTAQQGGNRDSNSHLQEVDLWCIITAQADPALSTSAHSATTANSTSASAASSRRHVIKEGSVFMMRQGGFPKRWAKKQVRVRDDYCVHNVYHRTHFSSSTDIFSTHSAGVAGAHSAGSPSPQGLFPGESHPRGAVPAPAAALHPLGHTAHRPQRGARGGQRAGAAERRRRQCGQRQEGAPR